MEESQKKVTVNIWASVARWPHLSVHFYWMMNNDLPFVSFSCFFPLYSFFGSFHYISRKFVYLLNIATLIKTLVAQTLSWIINAPRCSMCANVIVALPLISLLRQHQSWTKRAVTDWEDERKSNEFDTKVRKADIGCAPDDSTETFDSVLGNKVDYAGWGLLYRIWSGWRQRCNWKECRVWFLFPLKGSICIHDIF
jgi:hypothetical protein